MTPYDGLRYGLAGHACLDGYWEALDPTSSLLLATFAPWTHETLTSQEDLWATIKKGYDL